MIRYNVIGLCPLTKATMIRERCLDCYAMKEVDTRWNASHTSVKMFIVECTPELTAKNLLKNPTARKGN
jgi:hypothetical protein